MCIICTVNKLESTNSYVCCVVAVAKIRNNLGIIKKYSNRNAKQLLTGKKTSVNQTAAASAGIISAG